MRNPVHTILLIITLSLILLGLCGSPASAQVSTTSVGVFYIGPEDIVAEAINQANPVVVRVDQPELAQVIVINNARISEDGLRFYGDQVRNSRIGLVIFCGEMYPENLTDLAALLGISTFGLSTINVPATVIVDNDLDELSKSATWTSAPEIHARTVISNPNILLPLLSTDTGQPIIQRVRGREPSQTLIVGGWLSDPSNASWNNWPYFEYFIYRTIVDAAGRQRILSYADYPRSPVPHRNERLILAGLASGIIAGITALVYYARRFRFMRTGKWQSPASDSENTTHHNTGWHKAGFHRPLAGLLVLLPLNLACYFLLIKYRLYTLPQVIGINPNVYSSWQFVERWTEVIWLLLDAGTGIAAVRYFATLHVRHTRHAFRYFQFYTWWQLLIGAIQFSIVALLSATILPATNIAHLTYFILIQSIVRFPGFLAVFVLVFRAMQRFDYEQYLTFILTYGTAAFQAVAYLLYLRWGALLPEMFQDLTSLVGLGVGLYLAEWVIFILGMFLYLRQNQNLGKLFIPLNNNQISKQILSFGIRATFGQLALPLGTLIQKIVIDNGFPELTTPWHYWAIALQITYIFDLVLKQFYRNLISTLTEALTLNYKTLLRYYLTQGVRYGMWFSVFIFAVFTALDKSIVDIVSVNANNPVVEILMLTLSVTAFRWGVWLVEALLLAAERPGLTSILIIIEQVLYIGGGFFLAPQYGPLGFLFAYALGFLIRTVIGWFLMQRFIIRVHIYIWQTLISPVISGVLIYYLLYVILNQITPSWQNIFVIPVLLICLCVYAVLTAILGGWDDISIKEFGQAVRLSGISKPYTWVIWQLIRFGAWLSPLHGRFPIVISGIAEEQAVAITYTRSAS
jgi:hypothetical protein